MEIQTTHLIQTTEELVQTGETRPEDRIQEALTSHGTGGEGVPLPGPVPQGIQEGSQQETQGEAQETQTTDSGSQGESQALEQALSGLSEDQKQEFLHSLEQDPSRTWTSQEIRNLAYSLYSEEFSGAAQELQLLAQRLGIRNQEALAHSEEALWKRVQEELGEIRKIRGKTVRVEWGKGGETREMGMVHRETQWILRALQRPRHLFLTGPAGSGKTTCAEKVAEALGLTFYPISVGPETMKSDLLGYMDGAGTYHSTPVREAFEKGGLLLLDEMDAGNGASLTILNALLANGYCSFPDKVVHRHPSFRVIACANTFGRGADRMYVGRNQLDAATLDRFVVRAFEYDEEFERRLAGNDAWVDRVQAIRKAASELKLRVVVSPRASIVGAGMLEDGFSQKEVEEALIFRYDESFRRKMQERGL